jgi:hypothetical protein
MQALRTQEGQKPYPASRSTEARTSSKGRARGRPGGHPSSVSWSPARRGAWAAQGEVAWKGARALLGPARGCPGRGSHSLPPPLTIATIPPGSPLQTHPGAGSFPPLSFFIPEQRRRKGSCSLASPDAGGSSHGCCQSRSQRSGFPGPAPKPGPARAATWTLGPRATS